MTLFDPFHVTGFFLQPLKTPENFLFSDVFECKEKDQWYELSCSPIKLTVLTGIM